MTMPNTQIGIDIRMMRHTGIGTYIREILSAFRGLANARRFGITLFGDSGHAKEFPEFLHRPFHSRIYTLFEQFEYPWRTGACTMWHAPHYNVPLLKNRAKLVLTIHDLIHWIFRKEFFNPLQGFYAENMMRHALKSADHVIAVSNKTRDDLINHFDADPENISVIYEAVSDSFHEVDDLAVEEVRKKFGLPEEFFLYVGSLKPHKNILPSVRLFKKLHQSRELRSALVLVGKKDRKYPSGYEELAALKTGDGIIHLDHVSFPDLIGLYNGAMSLVHPSFYEGFGLTILEAMACGCPVIAARAASIPEVAGDGAYLIDPYSQHELREALIRFENAPTLRDDLRRKGKRQVQNFSWQKAASQTLEVYEKVLEESFR
ncbi:MAG: glycosyltransferase family 4 protein [Candidatus Omnitrophica bacterium]|nr:glycosyltransferase family 4 protein [Candidatus Omnitrophota bacterium]